MMHGGSFALCDFLAKDEGGKNDVATAVAAAARINFLIMLTPLTMFAAGWNTSALGIWCTKSRHHSDIPNIPTRKSRAQSRYRNDNLNILPSRLV